MQLKNKQVYLFIDSLGLGGAERSCVNYANIISKNGKDVTLVIYNSKKWDYGKYIDSSVSIINLNAKNGLHALPKLIALIAKSKVNLAICFNPQVSILVYLARLVSNNSFKIISRCVNNLSALKSIHSTRIKQRILNLLIPIVYSRMDHYISQCYSMERELRESLGLRNQSSTTIYNYVDDKFCINGPDNIFDQSKNNILFVGRFKAQKGIDLLTSILVKLLEIDNSYVVHLVGEGEDKSKLIDVLSASGFANNIIEYGLINNVQDYYRSADVTILSSRFEGFPNVLCESISCGTPVVSFDCPTGPDEIILEGENGYLIDDFNIDKFVAAIPLAVKLKGSGMVKLKHSNESTSARIMNVTNYFLNK